MNALPSCRSPAIPPMTTDAVDKVRQMEAVSRQFPQVEIATRHVFHAGMYARTICIPAGVLLTGVFIRIPTLLVFSGHATVFVGSAAIELSGHHVLPASAGRKQAFLAHADTELTMLFPTAATTVEEAESQFTDEPDQLFSRHPGAVNHITITGD